MMKKLFLVACIATVGLFSLQSCIRDHAMGEDEKMAEIKKFEMFARNKEAYKSMKITGSDLSYQESFKNLFYRYYELNPTNAPDFDDANTLQPDFSYSTQLFIDTDSSKFAVFPAVKNGVLTSLMVAKISKEEDFLEYYYTKPDDNTLAISQAFSQKFNTLSASKGITDSEGLIEEVIIPPPPKPIQWPPKKSTDCSLDDYSNGNCGTPPPSECPPYQNCNNPSSGGTPTSPPKPTPCETIQKVGKNAKTKTLMGGLKTKSTEVDPTTGKYKETGYALTENGGAVTEQEYVGLGGTDEIKLSITNSIDGYIHNHNPSGFSVFSPYDLATLSLMYTSGKIKDLNSFVFGVVTAKGTQYMITIDDSAAFSTFANKFLTGGMLDDKKIRDIDTDFMMSGINQGTNLAGNEAGMLHYFGVNNSGLKVMKGNATFSNWQQIEKGLNDQIIATPCN